DVVDARMALAHVYLLGGDHQRALPELQGLVPDLEKHYGPGHDFVWSAKRNIIECQVALGHHGEAMSAVEELIAEREARPGRQDEESAELRHLLSRLREEGVCSRHWSPDWRRSRNACSRPTRSPPSGR